MPLVPDTDTALIEEIIAEATVEETAPTKTFKIDLENGRMFSEIDNEEALKQFAFKAVATARSRYLIYSDEYGCEMHDLLGQDVTDAFLNSEVPRMVREALIYDDRVHDVVNISFTRSGSDLYVSFTIVSIYGDVEQEVTL